MSWRSEFGDEYEVPELIENAEGIQDHSWHNDVCPSFGIYIEAPHYVMVRIWVEHPDWQERECYATEPFPRFMVAVETDTQEHWQAFADAGIYASAESGMEYEVLSTDSATEALDTFMRTLFAVRRVLERMQ